MQLGNYDSGDGDGDCEVARSEIIPLSVIEGHKHCSHHVQIGRPDFNALVHEAAAPLQTREGIRAQLVVAACGPCNLRKANKMPGQSGMHPLAMPVAPNVWQLQENGRAFPPNYLHVSWRDYLYWDTELQ